jgi:regulator of replication initiation timing
MEISAENSDDLGVVDVDEMIYDLQDRIASLMVENSTLTQENRTLQNRLAEKTRHIDTLLAENKPPVRCRQDPKVKAKREYYQANKDSPEVQKQLVKFREAYPERMVPWHLVYAITSDMYEEEVAFRKD